MRLTEIPSLAPPSNFGLLRFAADVAQLKAGTLGAEIDMSQFPDDENGDVLRRMAAQGIDLSSPRIIDFEHCFPNEEAARRFLAAIEGTVLEAKIFGPDSGDAAEWEVQCRERMVPTHSAITDTEHRLAGIAASFGGYSDGWGSMSNPDGSPA